MTVRDMFRAMDNEQLAEYVAYHLAGIMLAGGRATEEESKVMQEEWKEVYLKWFNEEVA